MNDILVNAKNHFQGKRLNSSAVAGWVKVLMMDRLNDTW